MRLAKAILLIVVTLLVLPLARYLDQVRNGSAEAGLPAETSSAVAPTYDAEFLKSLMRERDTDAISRERTRPA